MAFFYGSDKRTRAHNKRTVNHLKGTYRKMAKVGKDPKGSQFSPYELKQIRMAKSSSSASYAASRYQDKVVTKRHVSNGAYALYDTFNLYNESLTVIGQGDDINNRLRQEIFVKGITTMLYAQNVATDFDPLLFRWAIVKLKGQICGSLSTDQEFYKGSNAQRYADFSSVTNPLHHMMYSINRTKWDVLAEGQKELQRPNSTTSGRIDPSNTLLMKQYIPVGKKIMYNSTLSSSCETPIFFFFWVTRPGSTVTESGQLYFQVAHIVHFQDPI